MLLAPLMLASKRHLGIIAFVCLMAVGLWFIIGQRGPSKLPAFDSAKFVSFDPISPVTAHWKETEAPMIRSLFKGINRDLKPMKWQVLGEITLFQVGKPVGKIEVFSNSQGPGPFKIGNSYYLGYDQAALQKALNSY